MKFIFRLIGILTVIIVLAAALLFYLDTKALLTGQIGALVRTLHILWQQAWTAIEAFGKESGITEDALDLLMQGVGKLEEALGSGKKAEEIMPTPSPEVILITPDPAYYAAYGQQG